LLLAVDFVTISLWGVVLKILWAWYMVPVFALPKLTIPQAIGIAITVGLITHQFIPIKGDKETILMMISDNVMAPVFALIFGAVVHLFL